MTGLERQEHPFVKYLQGLAARGDRGALAALRRGLSGVPGTVVETFPYVVPWLPNGQVQAVERAYFLVAALYALHPGGRSADGAARWNFGASFSALRERSGSIERRFVALLSAPLEDLPDHLRHAVSLLKGEGVQVDYSALLEDLARWSAESRHIQRAWARSFWLDVPADVAAPGADSETEQKGTEE